MKCFVVLLLLASTHTAFATDALPLSQLYSQALSAYQDKKFQDSTELFSKALQLQPENPELLYNLGLSQYQLNKKGYAIALGAKHYSSLPSTERFKMLLSLLETTVALPALSEDLQEHGK